MPSRTTAEDDRNGRVTSDDTVGPRVHPMRPSYHTTRRAAGRPPLRMVEADEGAAPGVARLSGHGHGQHDVVDRVEIRNQVARTLLPDKADPLAAIAVELAVTHAQQILPIHMHAPGRGPVQPAEDVHQRGFAAAAGADDGHQFALLDAQVQLAQRYLFQTGNLVDFDKPVTKNKGLSLIHISEPTRPY